MDQPVMTLREFRDVVLRVAAVDAERVQLENFARQVFVDAELAARGCARRPAAVEFGPMDVVVVEIEHHRGMLLDREQQVA